MIKWITSAAILLFSISTLWATSNILPREDAYYQVTEIEPNLFEIRDPNTGHVTYKNTSEGMPAVSLREVPEMVIDVETLDFDFYADRYVHWQDVHVWDSWDGLLIADTDQDGRKEILGDRNYVSSNIPQGEPKFHAIIMELTDEDNFQLVHNYPDSTLMQSWSGDLDLDENQELLLRKFYLNVDSNAYGNIFQNYEAVSPQEYATELNFVFDQPLLAQPTYPTIIDIDQDSEMDMIYYLDGGHDTGADCPNAVNVAEYIPTLNNFVNNYCFSPSAWFTSHFAVDDWDMDGQMEFATGGVDGEIYIVENSGPDSYQLIYEDTLDTYNAYLSTSTNDMNGNGKPELWIGGDRSGSGTTIFCFESVGNDEYENVFKFRLPGVFSFYDYGVVNTDIDKDGVDELMIWTAGFIFILKNTGPESYEIIYAHHNDEWDAPLYQLYFSVTSEDVSGDGYPELLISLSNGLGEDKYYFTEIYQPAGPLLNLKTSERPSSRTLLKAYPNPFNNSIMIKWSNLGIDDVSIQIFDIKGRLVNSVVVAISSKYEEGEFRWDATDTRGREVESGIYIIKASSTEYQLTTKAVLLE